MSLIRGLLLFVLQHNTNKPLESYEVIGTPEFEDVDLEDGMPVYTARLKLKREYQG